MLLKIDESSLVSNPNLSIAEGAVRALADLVAAPAGGVVALDLRRAAVAEPLLVVLLDALAAAPPREGRPLARLDLRGIAGLHPDVLEPHLEPLRSTLVLL